MSFSSDSRREVQSEESSRIESLKIELPEEVDDEPFARLIRKKSDPKSLPRSRAFKSSKPKISSTRLKYVASSHDVGDSNQRNTTKFKLEDLKRMANLYPWPEGVTLCLPVEDGDSLAKYPNCLVVHEESLKAGFRLPIPTFTREFLNWTELCPAQITPNSWRSISAYGIRCWELKKEPTFLGMQYLFYMVGAGNFFSIYMRNCDIISNPSTNKGWKNKWFLVKKGGGFDFNFPIYPGIGVKFRKGLDEVNQISGEERELIDALLSLEQSNLHYSELVSWENLEKAGLSLPHPKQSMTPGLSLIKSALREQNNRPSSRSEEASKKKKVGSRSSPGKEDGREQTNLHCSELVPWENLENAGLSLPHPRQSMKPGLSLIKSALREQNNRPSSWSEEASKKKKAGSRSSPGKEDERPSKKRFYTTQAHGSPQLSKTEHRDIIPAPPTTKCPTHQPIGGRKNPPPPPRQPNYSALSLTLEEANGLLKGATMNVDAVSRLGRLPDEQVTAEFAKALALSVYHANNLIEKHEKLRLSGSHAKPEGLRDDFVKKKKELKQELLRTKESAKRNEENLRKEINTLKDTLKKTQDENAEQHQRIQELEMDLSEAKSIAKEEFLNSSSFDRRVAHFNATYYMLGLKVGVRQAVKKFQHLDPKIVEFDPDFDDDCGYEVPDPPPYSSPFRLIPHT